MGYRVKDIELEEKNNRGIFEIEAKRGSQEYEILLGYPNLNVIKVEKDWYLKAKNTKANINDFNRC